MLRPVFRGASRYHHHAAFTNHLLRYGQITHPLCYRQFSIWNRLLVQDGGSGDKIRLFEQAHRTSKQRIEIDPEKEGDFEQREVKQRLAEADQELQELKKKLVGEEEEKFIENLPEDEKARVIEALRASDAEYGPEDRSRDLEEIFGKGLEEDLDREIAELMKEEEKEEYFDPSKPFLEEEEPLPQKYTYEVSLQHPYVDRFNKALIGVTAEINNAARARELWKWYRRCKQAVPSFLQSIGPETAQIVWRSRYADSLTHSTRQKHLQTLIDDTYVSGRSISPTEILAFIQALQDGGNVDRALELWEQQQPLIGQGDMNIETYWQLGVQLFAAQQNPQRAQDIALAFLTNNQTRHPRILIPVIISWAHKGQEAAVKVWALYLQFKTLLGPDMTMDDYDAISTGLLKSGHLDLALAVFKDMMATNEYPYNDSTALYKSLLGLAGQLQVLSITESEVNKVSLSALTVLPTQFHNRFFFASWMKKLIGMGEIDSAAMVVELMYERGIRPDAKHLNGLIGAWLRQHSSSDSRIKAERLAWSMVQERIDQVWSRQPTDGSTKPKVTPLNISSHENIRVPAFIERKLPQANIETFSILLLHYTRRGEEDMIKYLTKCLSDAQIPPNSYFMNHLLYADLRRHHIRALWDRFKALSTRIQPDLETFACLWDCAKLQYDQSRIAYDDDFPTARQLFSETLQWYCSLNSRGQRTVLEDFNKDIYDQITKCFCLSKDLSGTIVALRAMSRFFGFFPDDDTARMLIIQVARMAGVPAGTPPHRLRRFGDTPRSKENMKRVQTLLDMIHERKVQNLLARGVDFDELDESEQKQVRLEILTELLVQVQRQVLGADANQDAQVKEQLMSAAEEMGLGQAGLDLRTVLALQIEPVS